MKFTEEHEQIRDTLSKFIDREINPHADEWEEAEMFPAHEVFKKLGDQGFLGINKPEEYGGMGLDYSYAVVMAETLGRFGQPLTRIAYDSTMDFPKRRHVRWQS